VRLAPIASSLDLGPLILDGPLFFLDERTAGTGWVTFSSGLGDAEAQDFGIWAPQPLNRIA